MFISTEGIRGSRIRGSFTPLGDMKKKKEIEAGLSLTLVLLHLFQTLRT